MPHPKTADIRALLEALEIGGVEFIVVGGVAAVLHGAPTATFDLDVVHRRTPENVARLLAVLEKLDATIREPGNRGLRPDEHLLLHGTQPLLSTSLGPLDALCVLGDGRGYDELVAHTAVIFHDGRSMRVLDLDTLIEVKAAANRPKDRLMLPMLLSLRDQLKKK